MIGLLSSVVIMNVPRGKSAVEQQSERLLKDLNALSQDSLVSGEIRAFGVSETEFGFYRYDGTAFILAANTVWDDDIRLKFTRNAQRVKLPETLTPLIIFEPTKNNTPFTLALEGRDAAFVLRSEGQGRTLLERAE